MFFYLACQKESVIIVVENLTKATAQLHLLTGIKASNTTPYHPMGNGVCEWMNRTVINMSKTIYTTQKANWKDHVKHLMFA